MPAHQLNHWKLAKHIERIHLLLASELNEFSTPLNRLTKESPRYLLSADLCGSFHSIAYRKSILGAPSKQIALFLRDYTNISKKSLCDELIISTGVSKVMKTSKPFLYIYVNKLQVQIFNRSKIKHWANWWAITTTSFELICIASICISSTNPTQSINTLIIPIKKYYPSRQTTHMVISSRFY